MSTNACNQKKYNFKHEFIMLMDVFDTAFENLSEQPDSVKAKKLYKNALKRLREIRKKCTSEKCVPSQADLDSLNGIK